MSRVHVRDLPHHHGERVTVCGWAATSRLQRQMQFLLVRDHTGTVQVTHRRGGDTDVEATINQITAESAVAVTGRVVANPKVKLGGLEIVPERVDLVAPADVPLPIDTATGLDQRLDWRFLDLRRPEKRLVLDVQSTVEQAMRRFVTEEGFTELHTPKLMSAASESGAEVFRVQYFDRTAYLAQSPQFYKQMAIAAGIDRVFEIGPVFRAEPSFTARHATEFTGVDVEMAWVNSVNDVMSLEERLLHRVLSEVAHGHGEAIHTLLGHDVVVPELPFPRIAMAEAISDLHALGWDVDGTAADLDPAGERQLSALIAERTGHQFTFVTNFPSSVRPFYHMRSAADPGLTESFDLLWNGIEITTGAQREHRHGVLLAQAQEKGLSATGLTSYLNCFRFGCPPHGGFGLGLNRLVMTMLGLPSIREAMFLFRGPHRLEP